MTVTGVHPAAAEDELDATDVAGGGAGVEVDDVELPGIGGGTKGVPFCSASSCRLRVVLAAGHPTPTPSKF